MTSRRRFLGAAAALAGLDAPSSDTDLEDTISIEGEMAVVDDDGSGHAKAPMRDAWADVELFGGVDDSAHVRVIGEWLDDEPSNVELSVIADPAMVRVAVSPERARELAEDLERAADYAEGGGDG